MPDDETARALTPTLADDRPADTSSRTNRALRATGRGMAKSSRWVGVGLWRGIRPLMRRVPGGLRAAERGIRQHLDLILAALAAAVVAIGWPTIAATHDVPAWSGLYFALIEAAPIIALRRSPFVAWLTAAGGAVLWAVLVPNTPTSDVPWPVMQSLVLFGCLLVTALLASWAEVLVALGGTLALIAASMPPDLQGVTVVPILLTVFGVLVRWLVRSRRQLATQSAATEVERARRAVVEERSRIARELHDVVAHHMSMVVIQAQSAPVRLTDLPDAAVKEFATIEASARQALQEVRAALGVLRVDDRPADTAPQPGIEQMPTLLEGTRAAGVEVTWRLDLAAHDCPPGTALVLHRVLQESLTNAIRHSPGAAIDVELDRVGDEARLTVRNGPPSTVAGGADAESAVGSGPEGRVNGIPAGAGTGMAGMRARAEAVGGRFSASQTPDGRWVVSVAVPLVGRPQVSA